MKQNIRYVNCPYRTDENGKFVDKGIDKRLVSKLYDIKILVNRLEKKGDWLNSLIYDLEVNFIKCPNADWLNENRKELINTVCLMPELEILSTDTPKEVELKLVLGAKLIELINA